jgi:hypothetical protein
MPSTVIRSFDYSPDSQELSVEFITGRRYIYEEVPENVVEALRSAFGKGIYFNSRIRGRFRFREVESADSQAD